MRSLHHVRKDISTTLVVCLLILTVVSLGYGLEKPVAVVFPLKSDGVSGTTTGLVTERISELLGQSGRIQVLNRDDIVRIDETIARNMSDCTEEGCGIEMGRQLDADKIILGSISRVGERVTIIANYIDVGSTERKTSSVDIDNVPEEQLVDYVPELIAKMLLNVPLLQAKIVTIDGREMFINAGTGLVEVGQRLQVRRQGVQIIDPSTRRPLGYHETHIGEIEVIRLQGPELAKCSIVSGSGFQIHDFMEIPSTVQQEVVAIPTVQGGTTTTAPAPTRTARTVQRGGLAVNSDPEGATVMLGGEELGVTPLRRDGIEVGDRILLIHREGYVDNTQMVTISPGRTATATARLVRMTGTLVVKTDPVGAWITVNGEARGETIRDGLVISPLVIGSYAVRAELEHYHPAERSVAVRYNATDEVNLTLTPKPGAIFVSSTPSGAEIWIDDVLQRGKVTPVKITPVDPGRHTVRVRKGDYTVPDTTVTVPPERTVMITRNLAPTVIESPTPSRSSGGGQSVSGPLSGMEFALIPAGSFMMGSPSDESGRDSDEGPQHRVTISSFYMMTTEVTQGMWREVMGSNPSHFKGDNLPVESVSWNDVQEFLTKLNRRDPGKGYRLPSESEWEYACRAGTTTKYHSGNGESDLGRVGWYRGNSDNRTHPVGQKSPNSWGLYDMHGNVWEWCEDWYHSSYNNAPIDGSAWISPSGSGRVLRGGSWGYDAGACRSADRYGDGPSDRDSNLGFRLARSVN